MNITSNYIVIHENTTPINQHYICKTFNSLEEIHEYMDTIQEIITEDTEFIYYKNTTQGYAKFNSMYDLTYDIKSITIK